MKLLMRITFLCAAAYVCQTHLQAMVSTRVAKPVVSTASKNILSRGTAWRPCGQANNPFCSPVVTSQIKTTPQMRTFTTEKQEPKTGAQQKFERFEKEARKTKLSGTWGKAELAVGGVIIGAIAAINLEVARTLADAREGEEFAAAQTDELIANDYKYYFIHALEEQRHSVRDNFYAMFVLLFEGAEQKAALDYEALLRNPRSMQQLLAQPEPFETLIKMRALSFFNGSYYRAKGYARWDSTLSGLFENFLNKMIASKDKKINDLLAHMRNATSEKQKIELYKQLKTVLKERAVAKGAGELD